MLRFIRAIKVTAAVLSRCGRVLAAASTESILCSNLAGAVRLHIVKAGFIVGVGGGSGVLIYHGQRIPLSVSGIGLGSLGVIWLSGGLGRRSAPRIICRDPASSPALMRRPAPARLSSAADRWRGCRTKTASFSRCTGSRSVFRCPSGRDHVRRQRDHPAHYNKASVDQIQRCRAIYEYCVF